MERADPAARRRVRVVAALPVAHTGMPRLRHAAAIDRSSASRRRVVGVLALGGRVLRAEVLAAEVRAFAAAGSHRAGAESSR
jgi:hypothetical protein